MLMSRPGGIRTPDQGIMSPLLSPLSYGPETFLEHAFLNVTSVRPIGSHPSGHAVTDQHAVTQLRINMP